MIAKSEREQIIALINREVVPAIGCIPGQGQYRLRKRAWKRSRGRAG